jgi:hypothetical protein
MKQTAVEWLIEQIVNRINSNSISRPLNEIFEQALKIEKQQMLHFWQGGLLANESGGKNFETYYNETYKNNL